MLSSHTENAPVCVKTDVVIEKCDLLQQGFLKVFVRVRGSRPTLHLFNNVLCLASRNSKFLSSSAPKRHFFHLSQRNALITLAEDENGSRARLSAARISTLS